MNNSLVSIIIPTYNRAHLIGETLDSVLAQTYQNWECIIVDDGSTDNSEFVISKYVELDSRFQFYERPFDRIKGANSCRNYGFELSKGEYINWFDDDDVMQEEFIAIKLNTFEEKINVVISGGFYFNEMESRKIMQVFDSQNLFQDLLMWKLHIITNSVMFKRNFLQNKDLFSSHITRGQETEFFSRLFFQLPVGAYKIINEPLFLYRQHKDTKTARNSSYVHEFKESHAYIFIENFKRSILIDDKILINFHYPIIIDLFFRALENNHSKNTKFIFRNFVPVLKKKKKDIALQFYFCGLIFLFFKRGSYRLEKYFKSIQL